MSHALALQSNLLTDLWLFEFTWTNGKILVALWGLFIMSARAIFHFTTMQREEYYKRGAWRNWTLPSFSIRITHLQASSFQYCLMSNLEWLKWRLFSFLSFNLLFQFCKWDRYWLWRSSCREQSSFFPELRCPAAACRDFERTLSYFQPCCSNKYLKCWLKISTL